MTDTWQSTASLAAIIKKALMLKNIRAFFDDRSVMEVETPMLSRFAVSDPNLDSITARFRQSQVYLSTSPEYAMKRLLACFNKPLYQVCKAFRDDELGQFHNPEFTLLEWYRPDFNMEQLIDEVEALILAVVKDGVSAASFKPPFTRISYRQAFKRFGLDPHDANVTQCVQVAQQYKIPVPQGMMVKECNNQLVEQQNVNDWLDWLLTQLVVPSFAADAFTFLYDYPASQSSLARLEIDEQGVTVAKRFELFFGEIELANGFYELTNASEQLARFNADNDIRSYQDKKTVMIDEGFIGALEAGLPDCSGVAIGLDRLLMVLGGFDSIDQVLSFAWGRH